MNRIRIKTLKGNGSRILRDWEPGSESSTIRRLQKEDIKLPQNGEGKIKKFTFRVLLNEIIKISLLRDQTKCAKNIVPLVKKNNFLCNKN